MHFTIKIKQDISITYNLKLFHEVIIIIINHFYLMGIKTNNYDIL